ncbi:hypothetical protein P8452_13648 [Trifolium repens]|nr:hypothetical protein P8452_13648 [Trifolium repens]
MKLQMEELKKILVILIKIHEVTTILNSRKINSSGDRRNHHRREHTLGTSSRFPLWLEGMKNLFMEKCYSAM